MLGQETWFSKNLHKTGTTLCITAETVEGLTSTINANVSMHGYFLSHINVTDQHFAIQFASSYSLPSPSSPV